MASRSLAFAALAQASSRALGPGSAASRGAARRHATASRVSDFTWFLSAVWSDSRSNVASLAHRWRVTHSSETEFAVEEWDAGNPSVDAVTSGGPGARLA